MAKLTDAQRAARLAFKKVSGSTPQSEQRKREGELHERMARQKAARLARDTALENASDDDTERK